MRQSKLFAKTKKQSPKDAEAISHKLLVKGDFIDQLTTGVYSFLPLGWRVHQKIEQIIREEMNAIEGQEVFLPVLAPKKIWQETNRWETMDPPLFKLKDRHQKELSLGPTHEEIITDLARRRVTSYKDLPFYLYQIQNKFRNEMRSSGGLLRVREFIMKDLYSFHASEDDLKKYYEKVKKAYLKIFQRCGLKVVPIEAESGAIGGMLSHEFALIAESGEDKILACPKCDYGANLNKVGKIKLCPKCKTELISSQGIESGHIFDLGTKYSQPMKACFIDKKGIKQSIVMGCYGIGLGRLMAATVEVHHDQKGIIWPTSVAPFQVHLIELNAEQEAEKIYKSLQKEQIEVLYDDREESAGVKFADADLIGVPLRIVVSKKTLEKESVEFKKRNEEKIKLVKIKDILKNV